MEKDRVLVRLVRLKEEARRNGVPREILDDIQKRISEETEKYLYGHNEQCNIRRPRPLLRIVKT